MQSLGGSLNLKVFALNWAELDDPAVEILQRDLNGKGQFNDALPEKNKRLVKNPKTHSLIAHQIAYEQAGIGLKQLSGPLLKAIRAGEHMLTT